MAPSIQLAIDAAKPGDTIEIANGTYQESVEITTDNLLLRGADRNGVVLDGAHTKSNGIVVTADKVRVENLTVKNYTLNGVLVTGMSDETGGLARGSDGYERLDPEKFPPVQEFAVRYITAANNGLYGIYAFNSQKGLIENNYASGSSDSGIYVGQCRGCEITVKNNVAELNAVGYQQTNASDTVTVIGNRLSDNRLGMTLLSDYQEAFVPMEKVVVTENVISNSGNPDTPAHGQGSFGVGVGIGGAIDVLISKNTIIGSPVAGVEVASSEDLAPKGIKIIDNDMKSNKHDVAYTASQRAPGEDNCLSGQTSNNMPKNLASLWDCAEGSTQSAGTPLERGTVPKGLSYRKVTAPGNQPTAPANDTFDWASVVEAPVASGKAPDEGLLAEYSQLGGK